MLLNGIPRMEPCGWRGRRERQVGWTFPPITPAELIEWAAFELVEGPVLLHDRMETSLAIASMTFAAPYTQKGRPNKLADFMPHWDSKAPMETEQSADDIMEAIKSLAIRKHDKEGDMFYGDDSDVHP